MLRKLPIKNPVFTIGALMVVILLLDLSRRGRLPLISSRLIATSCKSVVVMLKKRAPSDWTIQCEKNSLMVTIPSQLAPEDPSRLPPALYRELANNLVFIAKNSLNESLERTLIVHIRTLHPMQQVDAITKGSDLAKLANIQQPALIARHLKATVQVQERVQEKRDN